MEIILITVQFQLLPFDECWMHYIPNTIVTNCTVIIFIKKKVSDLENKIIVLRRIVMLKIGY